MPPIPANRPATRREVTVDTRPESTISVGRIPERMFEHARSRPRCQARGKAGASRSGDTCSASTLPAETPDISEDALQFLLYDGNGIGDSDLCVMSRVG